MAKSNSTDFTLNKLDDLFSTQDERDNADKPEIRDIDISLIDDFPNHPFKVAENEELFELAESIKEQGVLIPAIVRPKENGRYEMIAGHRRKRASELAGIDTLRCIVSDLDDDAATIIMVDTNLRQRQQILPSEKAKAYKMRLEAMNRQGERTDLTFSPVGKKLYSDQTLAEETGESKTQIYRIIRLNNLVPELLEFVDEGKIGLRPAVEMSYLDEDTQRDIVDVIDESECFPSHAQTIRMRKAFEQGELTRDDVVAIMNEEKPNQVEKITIRKDDIRKYIPKSVKPDDMQKFICDAVKHYAKHLERKREQVR
ncbi:MAG: ParB/RepB/Spo0J family partition protein [Eubacterium sp.]|nr:ParB/RepB/Spo0J family partition protein [Eubacterium sp.]